MGCFTSMPHDTADEQSPGPGGTTAGSTNSKGNTNTNTNSTPIDYEDIPDENVDSWRITKPGLGKNEEYKVPRSFKLLNELEWSEKGLVNASDLAKRFPDDINWISYGLEGMENNDNLNFWNASIIPAQGTPIGDRIYTVKLITGETYPDDPPFMRFVQKVKLPFVDESGIIDVVNINKEKFIWSHEKTMLETLVAIRHEMNQKENGAACHKVKPTAQYDW